MVVRKAHTNLPIILIGDVILVTAAYFFSYLIRFEGAIPSQLLHCFLLTVFWMIPVYISLFYLFGLYKGMWRYTSVLDSVNLFKAMVLATGAVMLSILLIYRFQGFSRSVFIINGILVFLLVGGFRIFIRIVFTQNGGLYLLARSGHPLVKGTKKLIIVGAGSAGEKLIREVMENKGLEYHIVGLVDDDPLKLKQTLHGVSVLGAIDQLKEIVRKYKVDEIAIATPSATMSQMRKIVAVCKSAGVPYKTLPGMADIIQGKITLSKLREVRYEDLLHRAPIQLDNDLICGYLTGKGVMVTGGAGSIGSELCRQIAAFSPSKLIVVERNESALYDLALDLQADFPELNVISALAAVQNHDRMTHIFSEHRPQVVFHAAAYKHVPMMENHPWEAIFNNIVGSYVVLRQCHQFGVNQCVMVSTDKAVRPTNVMGATKRFVELLMQSYASQSKTRFMAVRFGNVLGSIGSVMPLFKKQIAAGGPVTVTHPEMTRYFMIIPEACNLILQAGAFGQGGEIFVLKMGTPVRIDDMARDLISLSGYRPDEEIEIRYTGLRPGEKLYEELITQGEDIRKTGHEDILVLATGEIPDLDTMASHVDTLMTLAAKAAIDGIKDTLQEVIPEYRPWTAPAPLQTPSIEPEATTVTGIPAALLLATNDRKTPSDLPHLNRISVEDRLFLQLLTAPPVSENSSFFEALPVPQWEKIIQSALKHQAAPQLYLRLKRTGLENRLPLKIVERLRKIYLYFAQLNLRRRHWIGRIVTLLNENQLPFMVLTNLHIGENFYHNIAATPITALSIYLHGENLKNRWELLNQISEWAANGKISINFANKVQYPFLGQSIPMQTIWEDAIPAEIAGCKVTVPCNEDFLLHLCVLFSFYYRYGFAGIRMLCDIRETLVHLEAELNWDQVLQKSRLLNVTKAVGLSLSLAQELLQAPVTPDTLKAFGAGRYSDIAKRFAVTALFDDQYPEVTLSPELLKLLDSESFFGRLRALGHIAGNSASAFRAPTDIHSIGLWGYLRMRSANLTKFTASCARTASIAFSGNHALTQQLELHHHNTLIWEWIQGKREFIEEPTQ